MSSAGFANLMERCGRQLIDAMPFGMGPMMRVMGKIPGRAQFNETHVSRFVPLLLADDDAEGNAGNAR